MPRADASLWPFGPAAPRQSSTGQPWAAPVPTSADGEASPHRGEDELAACQDPGYQPPGSDTAILPISRQDSSLPLILRQSASLRSASLSRPPHDLPSAEGKSVAWPAPVAVDRSTTSPRQLLQSADCSCLGWLARQTLANEQLAEVCELARGSLCRGAPARSAQPQPGATILALPIEGLRW